MKVSPTLLALLFAALPIAAEADTAQSSSEKGNYTYNGAVTATNLNPEFTGYNPAWGFNNSYFGLLIGTLNTGSTLQGLLINPGPGSTGNAFVPIYGFGIVCYPYNPAANAFPGYPYNPETTGVFGGTVTVTEIKPTGVPVVVANVVFPDSPHNGPYVNVYNQTLASPYTATQGSLFFAQVTAFQTSPTNIAYGDCNLTAILQPPVPVSK